MPPSVSIVIPTYNSERTLDSCLGSILSQDYPANKIEIVIADGGSTDGTLAIADRFLVSKIVHNPLRTGEAGKAVGVRASHHDVIALIDSDNILPSSDWLSRMVEPFEDKDIAATEPLLFTYRRSDPAITRYCALLGMNDVLCLFIGNYDRLSHLTGKWTGLNVNATEHGNYLQLKLRDGNIPTIGANGFLVRSELVRSLNRDPYLFDVDLVHQLVANGHNGIAKVKLGIIHLFAADTREYIRKTRRRVSDYLLFQSTGRREHPWSSFSGSGPQKLLLHSLVIVLPLRDCAKGYKRTPDMAWFFHLVACWVTLVVYGSALLVHSLRRAIMRIK